VNDRPTDESPQLPPPAAEPWPLRLLRDAGFGLITVDPALIVGFCNPAAAALLGRPPEEIVGKPLLEFVPPERRALARRQLERTLRSGEAADFEVLHQTGSDQRHIAVTVSPVRDGDALTGLSVCLRDITRSIRMLRAVSDTQKMAALTAMAGAVAHHFNNMLGGVITTLDFALAGDDPDALRRAVSSSLSALARANLISCNLLAFAEGDHSDSPLVDLTDAVKRHAAAQRARLRPRGITVDTRLEPMHTLVPTRCVELILANLTANAVEAMPNGGILRLELGRNARGDILLTVCDNGTGLPPEHAQRAFEPFFTTKHGPGAEGAEHCGLGLAVVHGIVKDLGGTATLATGPDGWTCCRITLPNPAAGSAMAEPGPPGG